VYATNEIAVRSLNGAGATFIVGEGPIDYGQGRFTVARCAYLSEGASLIGFTLTNGYAENSDNFADDTRGGGVLCSGPGAVVSNCTLVGNWACWGGGGAYGGTFYGCTFSSNTAWGSYGFGGGACHATLHSCTLRGNVASGDGGGARWGTLRNCTVYGNTTLGSAGSYCAGGVSDASLIGCIVYGNTGGDWNRGDTLSYCCTTPAPDGPGNITADPMFMDAAAGDFRLHWSSPCINAGTNMDWMAGALDADGRPRILAGTADMGAHEFSGPMVNNEAGASDVDCTLATLNGDLVTEGLATGAVVRIFWGTTDAGTNAEAWATNVELQVSGAGAFWTNVSDLTPFTFYYYRCLASNEAGVSWALRSAPFPTVSPDAPGNTHYANASNATPFRPYTSWLTAATNLQDAVDAASSNDEVLVTNGIYATGGATVPPCPLTNRVCVTRPMAVRSVNGPAITEIRGAGPTGVGDVRCAYLAEGASLVGFTLTNGNAASYAGGGVMCEGPGASVRDCWIMGNSSSIYGGGAHGGTLRGCRLSGNAGRYGGGARQVVLYDCTLSGNTSVRSGGGVYEPQKSVN
jgi:hypothetical protein